MEKTSLNQQTFDSLKELFVNVKETGSFGGVRKLYIAARKKGIDVSLKNVRQFLQTQETYTTYKPVFRKFRTPKVIAPYKNYLHDMDTAFLIQFADENDGYKYILVDIDILSKYLRLIPLKSLKSNEVLKAMKTLFNSKKVDRIRTDKGVEFTNKEIQKYFKTQKIKHYTTLNVKKANFAERVIKTIKTLLTKYFAENQTHRWIDIVTDVQDQYNNTYHRSIGMTPMKALQISDDELWDEQYKYEPLNVKPFKFEIGDNVKISKLRKPFEREYDAKWTYEIFIISDRGRNQGIPVYTLVDFYNEPIEGKIYEKELQKVLIDKNTTYKIEKIIKKKKEKGKITYLVRWLGWPDKFASYVSEADLKSFSK